MLNVGEMRQVKKNPDRRGAGRGLRSAGMRLIKYVAQKQTHFVGHHYSE